MLPDLSTALHDIDVGPEEDPRKRLEAKTKLQSGVRNKPNSNPRDWPIAQGLLPLPERTLQYVVQENKVIIVDENTGRLMTGDAGSDGLHQAVEAKEQVEIEARRRRCDDHDPKLLPPLS